MKKNQNGFAEKARSIASSLLSKIKGTSKSPYTDDDAEFVKKIESFIISICEYIIEIDLDIYSDLGVNEIMTGLETMEKFYDDNFSGSIITDSATIIMNFKRYYNSFYSYVSPYIPFGTVNNVVLTQINKLGSELREKDDELKKILKNFSALENTVNLKITTIDEMIEVSNQKIQEIVIAKFGDLYKKVSNKHFRNACLWLIAIIVLICIAAKLSIYSFSEGMEFMKKNEILLKYNSTMVIWIGSRLVIFTAIFTALGIAIKNYNANKHNEIINKHRQNALNTFETFVKSSSDDKAIKDALLMEVTRTIFGNQNTGFSTGESDIESPSKIIEIVKNMKE